MSIENCYVNNVTGERMVWASQKSSLTAIDPFKAHIQQAQPQFAEQLGETWGQVFKFWCALGTDVVSGDTLTVAGGGHPGTYSVRNVQKFVFGDPDDHLELVCVKDTP